MDGGNSVPFFMQQIKFQDIVKHRKVSGCSVCNTHEYSFPFPITKEIAPFLAPLGPLKFDLDKITLIKIDNDYIDLQGRVGRASLRIKFKKESNQQELFETQLAAYIGTMMKDQEIVF